MEPRASTVRTRLATRLLAAQVLVLVTAVVTAWLVAAAVGPTIFRDHLGSISHSSSPADATAHAEEAFREASVISLGVAMLAALAAASAVCAYVTRRITRPVAALAKASADVAAGRFDVAVPTTALGVEFDTLTRSFTAMAARLHDVEVTRRRLLADLAHEMRTPVAILDGYLEGFEDGVANPDRETTAMLRAQTRRLARLAEDITAVSRAEEHQLELHFAVCPAQQLVESAATSMAGRSAEKGVTFTTEVEPDLPDLYVDPDRLGQVLGNLLDNALRHTPPGGAVSLRAFRSGERITLQVADTGTGIAPEHLPHVFERFYRVDAARDRAHGGSGIGLAIAKALVQAHNGHITAAVADPEPGAIFTVTLPGHPTNDGASGRALTGPLDSVPLELS